MEGGGHGYVAAFCAGAGAKAGSIGYQEETSPTLKGSPSGNLMPSVLCLNDQGGQRMDISENQVGTLRYQMGGHLPMVMATQQGGAEICEDLCPAITAAAGMSGNNQPVVFENHGIDSRYTGPHDVAPTVTSRYGTGGNNIPLTMSAPVAYSFDSAESNSMKSQNPHSGCREVDTARTIDTTVPCPSKNQGGIAIVQPAETYAIAGNIIGREEKNGGNGLGCQRELSYTLTATDNHCVCEPPSYQDVVGALCRGDEKGVGNQYVSQDKCIVSQNLIRRLTPLECERLMDFDDGWTDIPGASDSKRYKALGNSVVVGCMEYVLRGIAYFLQQQD
jgi:DNA (cytosine-5)-methyltransferase 1